MRRFPLLLTLCLPVTPLGCVVDSESCTEIGCEDQIVVTFDQSPGSSYWFEIDGDGVLLPCNIPDQQIPADAAFEYDCGDNGVVLRSAPRARYSITVSIYDADSLAPIVEAGNVSLSVDPSAEPIAPNGVDCPPVCYERFGTLL